MGSILACVYGTHFSVIVQCAEIKNVQKVFFVDCVRIEKVEGGITGWIHLKQLLGATLNNQYNTHRELTSLRCYRYVSLGINK